MSKEYTPLVIAKSFTKQYYEIIHKKPQQLYRFYKDESNFFHGDENQTTETISGGDKIREKVESLNLAGAKVDLTNGSIDAQKSENNAVFLVVTGEFTMPGKSARPFIQSFFLVCQGGKSDGPPSYYVRNSVFRLFGKDAATSAEVIAPARPAMVTTAVFEEKVDVMEPEKAEPVVENLPEVTSEGDDFGKTVGADTSNVDDLDATTVTSEPEYVNVSVSAKEDAVAVAVASTASASSEAAPQQVKEVVPEPVVVKEKVKPASWACLFAGGGSPEPAAQEAPKAKKVIAVKRDVEGDKAAAASPAPGAFKSATPALTVRLSQLPENVTEEEIRVLFEPFGAIKKVDINLLKGFAFVDFADASGVKNAMAKKGSAYLTIRDTLISVEERQTKSSGGAGGRLGGSNNRSGGRVGGITGGARQSSQNKTGDKRENRGASNNRDNRNKPAGNAKPSTAVPK